MIDPFTRNNLGDNPGSIAAIKENLGDSARFLAAAGS
jgi:hypothetical protein